MTGREREVEESGHGEETGCSIVQPEVWYQSGRGRYVGSWRGCGEIQSCRTGIDPGHTITVTTVRSIHSLSLLLNLTNIILTVLQKQLLAFAIAH